VPDDGGPARIEVCEPEARIVREIFHVYVETGQSIRQIALDVHDRGIPSPTGKPIWGTSTLQRLLRNEAYIGTVYYNRRESLDGNGPRGARNRKTRHRERPREEWIPITFPAIISRDTFERINQIGRDNSKWNPRGAEWGAWLLRRLGRMWLLPRRLQLSQDARPPRYSHRYYYCRNHDLRAGSQDRRCPERNIRANELDEYVFQQVRQALLPASPPDKTSSTMRTRRLPAAALSSRPRTASAAGSPASPNASRLPSTSSIPTPASA